MAIEFVVEDGTGKSDATSYISVADMKQYWDNMGYDYSALTDDEIEVLLNKCTQAIDGMYFNHWKGIRSSSSQALQWPRAYASYPDGYLNTSTSVPKELPDAVSELAYIKNSGTDIQPTDEGSGELAAESVSVTPVSESKTYVPGTYRSHPKITAVEDILKPLLGPIGKYGKLEFERV